MTPEEIRKMIAEEIKKCLRVAVDKDTHTFTDKQQVIVTILWDGGEIDADFVTLD